MFANEVFTNVKIPSSHWNNAFVARFIFDAEGDVRLAKGKFWNA